MMNSRKCLMLSSAAIVAMLVIFTSAWSDTVVNGDVSGRWHRHGSPYIVNGDITLLRNDTLVVDPGVIVRFGSGTRFDVYGVLSAIGAQGDSILFHANVQRPGSFRWIKFDGNGTTGSEMRYCIVEYAEHGLHIINAEPKISNCNISLHSRTCLRLEGSRSEITQCNISSSQDNGIFIDEGSRARILENNVHSCVNYGIAIGGNSSPLIRGNSISNVTEHGIYLSEAGACSLSYNTIKQCGERGIYTFSSGRTVMVRNIVYSCQGDFGIYLYRSDVSILLNNTVYENDQSGFGVFNSDAQLWSNVLCLNGRDGIFVQGGNVTFGYNDTWSNGREDYTGIEPDQTNMSEDPQLVNPMAGDFSPAEGSLIINMGNPQYRDPDGTRSDIGAKFFNMNHAPEFIYISPEDFDQLDGDQEVEFTVQAEDADHHPITYTWYVNDEEVDDRSSYTHLFERDGEYSVVVVADDGYYMGQTSHEWSFEVVGSGVNEDLSDMPLTFDLQGPYPNPFNETTRISVRVGTSTPAAVKIFDLAGNRVMEVWQGELNPGVHRFSVNAADLAVGVYILTAESANSRLTRKIIILK